MFLPSSSAEIRPAKVEDAASACQVLRRSITECCVDDHRHDQQILASWLANKTPENVTDWFASPANFAVVASTGEQIVGVGMLTRAGKIVLCHVVPEVRFLGIGKALLQALESQAREWCMPVLNVCSTRTALAFYQRNGYVQGPEKVACFGATTYSFTKRLTNNYRQARSCKCAA